MTSDLTRPDLSIIIVSWNTVGYLRDCVNSVITEIEMDLVAGTTSIKTKFAELDLGVL